MKSSLKYKSIIIIYTVALAILCVLRTVQLFYMTDKSIVNSGLVSPKLAGFSLAIDIFTLILIILVYFCARLTCRKPDSFPCGNPMFVTSPVFAMAALIINCIFDIKKGILGYAAVCDIAGLIIFAFCTYSVLVKRRVSKLFSCLGCIYFLARLMLSFIYYNGLKNVTESNLEIFALCLILIYSIAFGQCACQVEKRTSYRLLLRLGLSASIMCFISSVPRLLAEILNNKHLIHDTSCSYYFIFLLGFYILFSVLPIYSLNNLASKIRNFKSEHISPDECDQDCLVNYYNKIKNKK